MKKTLMKYLLWLCLILQTINCISQIDTTLLSVNDSAHHYYVIKNNVNLSVNDFVTNSSSYSRLSSQSQLIQVSSNIDSFGVNHIKYKQLYMGVPIEKSKLIFHANPSNRLTSINGVVEYNLGNINTTGIITPQSAIIIAINASPSQRFLWNDSTAEATLKNLSNDLNASYYPKAELLISKMDELAFNNPNNYFLAYKIPISTVSGDSSRIFYVDAHSSQVIKSTSSLLSCFGEKITNNNTSTSVKNLNFLNDKKTNFTTQYSSCPHADCQGGTASNMYYYPSQYIYTEQFLYAGTLCRFRLKEVCSNTYVYVKKVHITSGNQDDYRDATNVWADNSEREGPTVFFGLSWSNRFWQTYLGRNSFDNLNHQIFAKCKTDFPTGFRTDTKDIEVGKDNGSNWSASLDVMAHELTHGVSDNEVNFVNKGESGSLSEAISDIFGATCEFWTTQFINLGKTANYELGEDFSGSCGYRRAMDYPENYCQPNTYGCGSNWVNPTDLQNDNGGIHRNNGVINKWFYLVSEGGTGTNCLGNQYCVKGVGRDYASWIVYQALRYYLVSNSDMDDMRFFTELTAFQIFGFSPVYHAVASAWYAVGLESNPITTGLPVDIFGITETSTKNYNYNSRIEATNYKVNSGSNIEMTSSDYIRLSADYQYNYPLTPTPGNVEIKLGSEYHAYIATGCVGGARFGNTTIGKNHDSGNEAFAPVQNNNNKMTNTVNSFLVMPNPTTGAFKLQLDNGLEYPKQIVIRDVLGRIVNSIDTPDSFEYEFSLSGEKDGVYSVIVYYSDNVLCKRIIKN